MEARNKETGGRGEGPSARIPAAAAAAAAALLLISARARAFSSLCSRAPFFSRTAFVPKVPRTWNSQSNWPSRITRRGIISRCADGNCREIHRRKCNVMLVASREMVLP